MIISPEGKGAIDNILNTVTSTPNCIPGIIYAAIDKHGSTVYEGAAGVRSVNDPSVKVSTHFHVSVEPIYN